MNDPETGSVIESYRYKHTLSRHATRGIHPAMWRKGGGALHRCRSPENGRLREIMIHIVQDWNAQDHAAHLEQMFALRARVFGGRLGWDVVCDGGLERDALDDASPVYVLATDEADRVVGACRLLPTTGPTLLEACFRDTIPDAVRLVDPTIWECTRFCTASDSCDGHLDVLSGVTRSVIRAVVDLASHTGIETIIANIDALTLRMCRRAGHRVSLLGMTRRYGRPVYLGAFAIERVAEVECGPGERVLTRPERSFGARRLVDA